MNHSTTSPIKTSFAPSHTAFYVLEGKSSQSCWTRIGSAWQHADGQGFTVQIAIVPEDGRIVVRRAPPGENE